MSLGMVEATRRPSDARGLRAVSAADRDARDPEGVAQPHLADRSRLPGLGAKAREIRRGRDHRERAARQLGPQRERLRGDRPAERETQDREALVEPVRPDQLVDHGVEVEVLGGAECVAAAAVAVAAKVQRRDVVAPAQEVLAEKEVLSGQAHPPEPGREHDQLSRGAPPQRVGDRHAVGGGRAAMADLVRESGACARDSCGAHSGRQSTRLPAVRRSASGGIRMSAFARACAARSWLPRLSMAATRFSPPTTSRRASR